MVEMFEFKGLHNHEMTCINTTTRQKMFSAYCPQQLSNLVDLLFQYYSLSNIPKTTILFPCPLTFLQ